MRKLSQILLEKEQKKKEKEKKVVFVETDPKLAFPNDTVSALEKQINKFAKDLERDWKSPMELVSAAFEELEVPKPLASNKERWAQYLELISTAVKNLYDARGFGGNWRTIV